MMNKDLESGVEIKPKITDIKIEIKNEDSDDKTTEIKSEMQEDDNNIINNKLTYDKKQENSFNSYNLQNAESQDKKPIVNYFVYEERIQEMEQHSPTADIELEDNQTRTDDSLCFMKKEKQSNEHSVDESSQIEDNPEKKPIVKYFEYDEMIQVKMEKDLLPEENEVDGNLSQSAGGESGLVVSDVRSLCKKGKL